MAFKMAEGDWMSKLAMNRQMVASSFNDAVRDTATGVTNAVQSNWNDEGTGFQHAGEAATAAVTGAYAVGMSAWYGIAMKKGLRSWAGDAARSALKMAPAQYIEAAKYKGTIAGELAGGSSSFIGRKTPTVLVDGGKNLADDVMKKGTKGVFRMTGPTGFSPNEGRFIRNSRLLHGWGAGLTMAAFIAVPMIAGTAFGLAGQFLDEAHTSYMQAQAHSYDTRDFNNRAMYEWNMNKQNQMMTNMMPYEQNMMSMARAYHSR